MTAIIPLRNNRTMSLYRPPKQGVTLRNKVPDNRLYFGLSVEEHILSIYTISMIKVTGLAWPLYLTCLLMLLQTQLQPGAGQTCRGNR